MKRIFSLALAFALAVTTLAGCAGKQAPDARTPEELTELYTSAITENGGEGVRYNPVISAVKEDDDSALLLESIGLSQDMMTAFGLSVSMMNVQAYGIAAVMPAEGQTAAVEEALQGFVQKQKDSFETYLADQYEVASAAKVETLRDGTVLMVMGQDQDAIFQAIADAIQGK